MNLRHYRADALMLITALIWGSTFVAQRLGMDHIGPFLYTGLRFAIGAITLLPLIWLLRKPAQAGERPSRLSRPMLLGSLVLGLVLTLGINLQQVGLLFTTVTNSGFITGLYVILVPLLGLFVGYVVRITVWSGALVAIFGLYLLSVQGEREINPGDILVFLGTFAWAFQVLVIGWASPRTDPMRLAVLQIGVAAILMGLTTAQTGWLLRPFIARPTAEVTFLRPIEADIASSLTRSTRSAAGDYRGSWDPEQQGLIHRGLRRGE